MAPYSHLLVRLCVFMVVFCVFVFLYIVCVFVLVCVSLRESLTCDLSSCSSEAPPNSHLGREKWNWGGERRRQPVLRRISWEDFLLAASSHKSHACKVSLTGESTDSLGYFLRKRFFSHLFDNQIIYRVTQKNISARF